MQYLVDFIRDHVLDEQLYCAVPATDGELELSFLRLADPLHWLVRPAKSEQPAERVPSAHVVAYLESRGADLGLFERELRAIVAAHIVVAHQLLTAAGRVLGAETVAETLRGHELFARALVDAVQTATSPRLTLLRGEGLQTHARSGHLALVN
jgi:hypothetical protein